MTAVSQQQPGTASGRALWENPMDFPLGTGDSESPFLLAILAIEQEARAGVGKSADTSEPEALLALWRNYWHDQEGKPLDERVGTALRLMVQQMDAYLAAASEQGAE
jgi:hypothetical protein